MEIFLIVRQDQDGPYRPNVLSISHPVIWIDDMIFIDFLLTPKDKNQTDLVKLTIQLITIHNY